MTPTITIWRGDSYERRLVFKTSAGVPINITGGTIRFTIKENEDDATADAILEKKIIAHTTPAGGISQLTLTPDDTDIEPGDYYFDFQYKDSANKVTTLLDPDNAPYVLRVVQDITLTDDIK